MMGAGDPAPFERLVVLLAWCLAALLALGAVTAPMWAPAVARIVRRGALVLAIVLQGAFHLLAPPRSAMESAGRLVFLWPAAAVALVAAGTWSWRDGRRA